MAIGSFVGYSILPALEVHLLQTKLHALLSGAGLSTLLDLNKATLPPSTVTLLQCPHLRVQLVVHHPLEAPGGVAARGGGEAVLLDVDGEHRVLGLGQLA